jgi:hypothetical protein
MRWWNTRAGRSESGIRSRSLRGSRGRQGDGKNVGSVVLIDYQADTAEAAEAQFREQYETHGPPVVVHERLHTAHPAPIPAPDETENG